MGAFSRREAMKLALRGAAYAAPVALAAMLPVGVAAATPASTFDTIMTVAVPPATVHNGGTITFTITFTNNGPGTASAATGGGETLSSFGTAAFTFVSASVTAGTYTPPVGGTYTGTNSGTWTLNSPLAAGQSVTLTLTVRQSGQTVSTAITYGITATAAGGTEINPANNTGTATFSSAP
jgi:uncharacterized repeat protein (TIGR01451 family)